MNLADLLQEVAALDRAGALTVLTAAAARLAEGTALPLVPSPEAPDDDRLLTTREAAELLGHLVKFLYRHAKSPPRSRGVSGREITASNSRGSGLGKHGSA